MGAGASSVEHLSGLQKNELTRQIKEEYTRCLEQGLSTENQRNELFSKYCYVLEDVKANPFKNLVSSQRNKPKYETSARETRRRSYDRGTIDIAEESEPTKEVDTWDSVSNQPSCIICGMVFATTEKLNNHIKQSVRPWPCIDHMI
jgi:hypothetical protein